jgi:hypothetical protein
MNDEQSVMNFAGCQLPVSRSGIEPETRNKERVTVE